jgi:hypothetical protein
MLFTTLLLPVVASAALLQERDTAASALVVEKLQPKLRKTAERAKFKVGPYTLNASKGTGSGLGDSTSWGQAFFYTMARSLCNKNGPCTILAAKVGVEYTDGKEAHPSNGIYIHHILTSDSTKKTKAWLSNCGSSSTPALNIAGILGGTAFVGAGEDSAEGGAVYTSDDGTRNTGYHVGAADSFTGWAQLVNYNKEAKKVYVYYDVEWVPGIQGDDVKTATFTATCGGSPAIRLSQTGPTNTTSGKFTFMEDGKILGARGHLHDGGVKVVMYLNDKFACASDAVYGVKGEGEGGMMGHAHGDEGGKGAKGAKAAAPKSGGGATSSIKTISSMTACQGPFTVKKGDSMKLVAVYDLSKHPLRTSAGGTKQADVMGMMGVSFTASKK